MKNIPVAGGAGFIGSHLCECLLHQGHQIICLDNFRTGSLKNVSPLMNNPCFKLVEHDITMPYKIQGIDEIYNLACPASPVHYQVSPVETVKTSFIGTLNLLELAHDNQCKLLQASTSEVYGDPEIHPQPEHYWGHVNPNGIRSCYDEGKRCAESLCMDFYREYGVEVKIIRIFNTYGPRMACDDGRVVSNCNCECHNDDCPCSESNGNCNCNCACSNDSCSSESLATTTSMPSSQIDALGMFGFF